VHRSPSLFVRAPALTPPFLPRLPPQNFLSLLMNIIRENNVVVQVQIIQSMSILIQNMTNETAVYYLLSNNHINDIIVYSFDFSHEELRDWFASFLKVLLATYLCFLVLLRTRD
jgi:hypothetical protein